MHPGAAGGDQLVAALAPERQVGDPVAMEVAELPPAEMELDVTSQIRPGQTNVIAIRVGSTTTEAEATAAAAT